MSARATTPPMTPPAMAPVFVPPSLLDCGAGLFWLSAWLGVVVAVVGEMDEEDEEVVEFGFTLVTWPLTIYLASEVPQQVLLFSPQQKPPSGHSCTVTSPS